MVFPKLLKQNHKRLIKYTVPHPKIPGIPLSSQLQTSVSLLQTNTKTSPGVDQEVQRERKWDVYLGDTYAKNEKDDKQQEREIRADPTLKA